MRDVTRRDVCAALSALALARAGEASGLGLQVHASETPPPKSSQPVEPMDRTPRGSAIQSGSGGAALGEARVLRLQDMPAHASANGSESRSVTHGTLPTGETVNLHQTTQPAGAAPVALHVIRHTEFVVIREGEVEFDHEDAAGQTLSERAKAGDVIYVPTGTSHRMRNVGEGPASYLVVAIGGDAK